MRNAKRGFIFIGLFPIFLGLLGFAYQPQVYYVSPSGDNGNNGSSNSPWRTISYAIENVPRTDVEIIVKAGVYNECIVFRRSFETQLHLRAETPYKTRIQCNAQTPIIELTGSVENLIFEGFEVTRPDSLTTGLRLVTLLRGNNITFRNNIFRDSYDNDLMIVGTALEDVLIEGNMFYNQTGKDEHIDINGANDVIVQDNIFFNDFAGSGRINGNNTFSYIVIKDSLGDNDGEFGAMRTQVRRNIFLNWEGAQHKAFIHVGEDGRPYFEAQDTLIENNLFLGNSSNPLGSPIIIRGSSNTTVRANTIAGNLPAFRYGIQSFLTGENLLNENISIHNNIWADPTGTMDRFSCCNASETVGSYTFDNNLYFNDGDSFPTGGDTLVRINDDENRVIGDPKLGGQNGGIIIPRWTGLNFAGGYNSINEIFIDYVNRYGSLGAGSAAIDQANPTNMPEDDILGRDRSEGGPLPDIGAYEVINEDVGFTLAIEPDFQQIEPGESAIYTISLAPLTFTDTVTLTVGRMSTNVVSNLVSTTTSIPMTLPLTLTSTHVVSPLIPGELIRMPITATGGEFTRTRTANLLIGEIYIYVPVILKDFTLLPEPTATSTLTATATVPITGTATLTPTATATIAPTVTITP